MTGAVTVAVRKRLERLRHDGARHSCEGPPGLPGVRSVATEALWAERATPQRLPLDPTFAG